MKAIITRYLPHTATKPSRIVASDCDGNRVVQTLNDGGYQGHLSVAEALCNKMKWPIGPHSLRGGATRDGYAFVFVDDLGPIQRRHVTTRAGHTLEMFYNPENDLLVIDLTHKSGDGGNEIVRKTLDEKKLLRHLP